MVSGEAFKSNYFKKEGELPVIKISNIGYGRFIVLNQEFLPNRFSKEYPELCVYPGTILMALTRPITNNTLKVCPYPANSEVGILNQRVAMIKPLEGLHNKYLLWYTQSNSFKLQVSLNMSETLQPNLSPVKLASLIIPMTSMEEQKIIVNYIESSLSLIDSIMDIIKRSLLISNNLRQSILKSAFHGKLVSQNSKDESADILLQKIKNERSKMEMKVNSKTSSNKLGFKK